MVSPVLQVPVLRLPPPAPRRVAQGQRALEHRRTSADRAESARVAITGPSGLIGTRARPIAITGATATTVTRRPTRHVLTRRRPDTRTGRIDAAVDPHRDLGSGSRPDRRHALEGLDAVVHLAGVGIADSRWTARAEGAHPHARARRAPTLIADARSPARRTAARAAVGLGDRVLRRPRRPHRRRVRPPGTDFTARVCIEWEAAARAAVDAGVRVAFLRTGIVQSTEGGALAKQLPFFRFGLGGKVGSGRQYVSWITIEDEVRAIEFLLDHDVSGPVNLAAPEPVTQRRVHQGAGSGAAPPDHDPADDRAAAALRPRARRLAAADQRAGRTRRRCSRPASSSSTPSSTGRSRSILD